MWPGGCEWGEVCDVMQGPGRRVVVRIAGSEVRYPIYCTHLTEVYTISPNRTEPEPEG
jgi:hypothetical protein